MKGLSADVHGTGPDRKVPHRAGCPVPLVAQRQEELPQRNLPQLAARFQRRSNDVRHCHCKSLFRLLGAFTRQFYYLYLTISVLVDKSSTKLILCLTLIYC